MHISIRMVEKLQCFMEFYAAQTGREYPYYYWDGASWSPHRSAVHGVEYCCETDKFTVLACFDDKENAAKVKPNVKPALSENAQLTAIIEPALYNMFKRIKSDDKRYLGNRAYLEEIGEDNISTKVYAIVKGNKHSRDIFISGEIRNENLLRRLPRPSKLPGWYLSWTVDSFTGKIVGVYVGQSINIDERTKAHAATIRRKYVQKPTLYHDTARRPGRRTYFVELASFNRDVVDLPLSKPFLNMIEMFFALSFQTLQRKHLAEWLPKEVDICAGCGVNTALPLSQSTVDRGRMLLWQTDCDDDRLSDVRARHQTLLAGKPRR